MPDVLVPIGSHFFTPQALTDALNRAIPQADLQPGDHGAAAASVDADGVKVALIFTSKDDHWRIRGAYGHDWSGDNKVAGDILYKF